MASTSTSLVQEKARYSAIADELARQIEAGELPRGAQLRGERELSRHFDASRATLRKALIELRERGMIEADSSRGWFVCAPVVGEANALMSFSEMAQSRGLKASSQVIAATVRPATIGEAEALRVAPGSELFDLERVRRLDGVAVGIERSRIPLKFAPGLPKLDFTLTSLYAALDQAGARPAYSEYSIQAVPAPAEDAALLDVAPGTPLLSTHAVTHLQDGRPIEVSRCRFLGDRYRFNATLFRSRPNEGA
jgi:GntR family transcriptional regulator